MLDNINIDSIFSKIKDYCAAVYYGGSRVDPVINNPHDYDYICFADRLQFQKLNKCLIKNKLKATWSTNNKQKEISNKDTLLLDFSQIRGYPYTQITWFSYLDVLMIKAVGEDVCPKTDIINEHRAEFIICLKEKTEALRTNKIQNQKRWYHILRGVYIVMNNSYEVTPEQRVEINILHDMSEGFEVVRDKTIELVKAL